MPRRASRAVPQRMKDLAVVLKGTASHPLVFDSTRAPLRTPVFHTSSGTLPCRTRQPGILHDILDQMWVDHQREPVHSPFQDPTQKLDGRLACLPEMHVSKEHGVSHVFSQLFHLGRRAHIHVVVHVTHGPQRSRTLLWTHGSRALWTSRQSPSLTFVAW